MSFSYFSDFPLEKNLVSVNGKKIVIVTERNIF